LNLMKNLVKEHGKTIVMVTHDPKAASFGTRLIKLKDGLLDSDEKILHS
jgi:putative ABC transport system ATP-binding protein